MAKEIKDSDIRICIWQLKVGKTKKAACQTLGITYNTKRLVKIIQDFKDKEAKTEELKKKARNKTLSDSAKKEIAKDYQSGESVSGISERLYLTSPRIKKVLLELGVPIRGRGKKTPAKTEHVKQDLEVKFVINERVFVSNKNCFGIIKQVYDENYIEEMSDGYTKIVYLLTKKNSNEELKEGIHYEIYWITHKDEGTYWKVKAFQQHIKKIENNLVDTGRENYEVWLDNDYGGFYEIHRNNLFPLIK